MENNFTSMLVAISCLVLLCLSSDASAAIVKFQAEQSCSVDGLDDQNSVQGGVHCDGDDPFSLTDILNGSIALWVGDSQTPSWNIINDTGQHLDSLTLFYFGQLASNSFIDMQRSGDVFSSCTATTADNVVTSDSNCGSGDKTSDDPALALMMEWSGGTGLAANEVFNIKTASFAHAGEDAGCLSGTANCLPPGGNNVTVVPEPNILILFGIGLLGATFLKRRNT